MALEVGSRLGHYDVTALIGEDGMGQVWRAHDTPPALMVRWMPGVSRASVTSAFEHH